MTGMQIESEAPFLLEPAPKKHPLAALPEIRTLLKGVLCIGGINLLVGVASVGFALKSHSLPLGVTGLMSLCTFGLLRLLVRHMTQTRSWPELGVMMICGIYFPCYMLWVSAVGLLEMLIH